MKRRPYNMKLFLQGFYLVIHFEGFLLYKENFTVSPYLQKDLRLYE